jgi:hypothetical protein
MANICRILNTQRLADAVIDVSAQTTGMLKTKVIHHRGAIVRTECD